MNIPEIDPTNNEIINAPQTTLTIEMHLPNNEIAYISPYPTVVIVITTHQTALVKSSKTTYKSTFKSTSILASLN